MRGDIRILLVGDDGVGKSTLVSSVLHDSFPAHVAPILPPVAIPPTHTNMGAGITIVDSSLRMREHLEKEVRLANVICIVYSIADRYSFLRVPQFWLPYIRSLGVNVPVVLVGNKIDMRGSSFHNKSLQEEIGPIMREFKEVETCIECSAKHPVNVAEVFYFARKAVIHPTSPLYDFRGHSLKPACVGAFTRIFRLSDKDHDGSLSDAELNEFQKACFGIEFTPRELDDIRDMVSEGTQHGVDANGGLTLEGFLYLKTALIRLGRIDSIWDILRHFGYDDDLGFVESYLHPAFPQPTLDTAVELSPSGYHFFTELFTAMDLDQDGSLNAEEVAAAFSIAPNGCPWTEEEDGWPHCTLTTDSGSVTLQGFLAQWSLTTLLDHQKTLEYLALLGYEKDTTQALKTVQAKRRGTGVTSKSRAQRGVFLCYVVGSLGCGKSSLLRAFVQKSFTEKHITSNRLCTSVVNAVEINGVEKYLVLQEIAPGRESEVLGDKKLFGRCDLMCFVHDSTDPNSFAYITELRKRYDLDRTPSVFVATKCDLDCVQQRVSPEMQPDVYCRELGVAPPRNVSVKEGRHCAELFHYLTEIAVDPTPALPGNNKRSYRRYYRYARGAAIVVGTVGIGVLAYKFLKTSSQAAPAADTLKKEL